jgi:sec-independent protein translocase protein TatA
MFGTLGVQEMIIIFLVALVLFGPKKLPELGKTIGKALTEFRRASNDLKSTFEREMHTLEQEGTAIQQAANTTAGQIYQHATSDPDPYQHWAPEPQASIEPPAHSTPETVGASEVPGAESHEAAKVAGQIEGTVPHNGTAHHETAGEPAPAETPQHT